MSEKKSHAGGVDADLVRDLARVLSEEGLTEIEVEHGEMRLRLAKQYMMAPAAPQPMYAPAPAVAPAPVIAAAAPVVDLRSDPRTVTSPMVGTAYLLPEPGAKAFVGLGDTVTVGQTLLMVEAMKTFNPITAPRAGKIVQIVVGDGQPVEFGEPLLVLE
jgi:acetyl-CoA carboxylase biotin carboxyl carrier protein